MSVFTDLATSNDVRNMNYSNMKLKSLVCLPRFIRTCRYLFNPFTPTDLCGIFQVKEKTIPF